MPRFGIGFGGGRGRKILPDELIDTLGPHAMVSSTAYARYVGHTDDPLTELDVVGFIHGAAAVAGGGGAGLNWAEFAIAISGNPARMPANLDLTILGTADVTTEALNAGAGSALKKKTIAALRIPAGAHLWVLASTAFQTTNMTMRYGNSDGQGRFRTRAACRPSLNLNAPLAFATTAPTVASVMALYAHLP